MTYSASLSRRMAAWVLALVMLLTSFAVPAYAQADWERLTIRLSWLDAGRGRPYLAQHSRAARAMPAGRPLALDEAVQALVFLLSREAVGINACSVDIDGGLNAVKLPEVS